MAGKTAVISVEHPGVAEGHIAHKTHHAWFKEAEAALKNKGLTGEALQSAADAERWKRVGEFMKTEGKSSYRIELAKGRGYFLALNKVGLEGARITTLSGSGAAEVIAKMTLAGRGSEAAAAAEAAGLSQKAAARFGTSASVIKWVGRPLIVVAVARDAYEIHEAGYTPRTITSVAIGWAGAWKGMRGGAWVGTRGGAALAGVVGQCGPQALAPEELVTVPVAGAVGGIIFGIAGGIGGYYSGRTVTETVYDWTFTPSCN